MSDRGGERRFSTGHTIVLLVVVFFIATAMLYCYSRQDEYHQATQVPAASQTPVLSATVLPVLVR